MLLDVKHITSSFLPKTASKIDEVLERVHNEVREEYENCGHKFQKLKEARAHVLKLLGAGHGQKEDMKDKEKVKNASLTSCKNVHADM